jgi:hypothetical protein
MANSKKQDGRRKGGMARFRPATEEELETIRKAAWRGKAAGLTSVSAAMVAYVEEGNFTTALLRVDDNVTLRVGSAKRNPSKSKVTLVRRRGSGEPWRYPTAHEALCILEDGLASAMETKTLAVDDDPPKPEVGRLTALARAARSRAVAL